MDNNKHFQEAREQLDKWAENMILAVEKKLKDDTKAQIKALNRQARASETIDEQHELQKKGDFLKIGDLRACNFGKHLFQPLFHVRSNSKITILPVTLNESEYQYVTDLKTWCDNHNDKLNEDGIELYLLRNMSRGNGVGFFEADNFHPDFILWMLVSGKQYVTFIEPYGLIHERPGSKKVQFHKRIKNIEKRLNDPTVILNSFILSWTRYPQ